VSPLHVACSVSIRAELFNSDGGSITGKPVVVDKAFLDALREKFDEWKSLIEDREQTAVLIAPAIDFILQRIRKDLGQFTAIVQHLSYS
jgi:hypothetical protein